MGIKERVTARVVDLFSHSERPLQNTEKYEGDPGLFGPGSISWEVLGDVSSFVGGIRALLIQAAHPEVTATRTAGQSRSGGAPGGERRKQERTCSCALSRAEIGRRWSWTAACCDTSPEW